MTQSPSDTMSRYWRHRSRRDFGSCWPRTARHCRSGTPDRSHTLPPRAAQATGTVDYSPNRADRCHGHRTGWPHYSHGTGTAARAAVPVRLRVHGHAGRARHSKPGRSLCSDTDPTHTLRSTGTNRNHPRRLRPDRCCHRAGIAIVTRGPKFAAASPQSVLELHVLQLRARGGHYRRGLAGGAVAEARAARGGRGNGARFPVWLAAADVLAAGLGDETALTALACSRVSAFLAAGFRLGQRLAGRDTRFGPGILALVSSSLGLGVAMLVLRLMPASPAAPCLGAGIPLEGRQPPGEWQAGQQPQQATARIRTRHGAGECVEGRPIQDA